MTQVASHNPGFVTLQSVTIDLVAAIETPNASGIAAAIGRLISSGELEVGSAEAAGKDRDEPAGLAAEEMIDGARNRGGVSGRGVKNCHGEIRQGKKRRSGHNPNESRAGCLCHDEPWRQRAHGDMGIGMSWRTSTQPPRRRPGQPLETFTASAKFFARISM